MSIENQVDAEKPLINNHHQLINKSISVKIKSFIILITLLYGANIYSAANISVPENGYVSVYTERIDDPLAVYFTPDQFDMVADGSCDVSNALQAAINKVQETIRYGVLFIPEGT